MADLLAQAEDDLRSGPLFVAATRSRLQNGDDESFVAGVRSAISKDDQARSASNRPARLQAPLRVSAGFDKSPPAAALVALVATLYRRDSVQVHPSHRHHHQLRRFAALDR